jgi:ABC-2 type transport system ATP-binding protein
LVSDGVTIFLTTQYLDEADELADRIGVLDHGHLVAEGTSAQLKARISGGHIELTFANVSELDAASRMLQATSRDDDALTLQLPGDGSVRSLRALFSRLDDAGIEVATVSVHTPDLDDVFFAVTGRPAGQSSSDQHSDNELEAVK